jgi:hypothetical protein
MSRILQQGVQDPTTRTSSVVNNKARKTDSSVPQHLGEQHEPKNSLDRIICSLESSGLILTVAWSMPILLIANSSASRSCLQASGFHTCKYIDNLYTPSAGCNRKVPSIMHLILNLHNTHKRVAQQVQRTSLVCPTHWCNNLKTSAKHVGFQEHPNSFLTVLHINVARGQEKGMWLVPSNSSHKAHLSIEWPRLRQMFSFDGSCYQASCHGNTRIFNGAHILQMLL